MPTFHLPSCARIVARIGVPTPRSWLSSLGSAALVAALVFNATVPAVAGPFLNVGSVATFAAGPDEQGGPWTLGDKDFLYLESSDNWTGAERIKLTENTDAELFTHQFLINDLDGYSSPITLMLGYQVHINGSQGPKNFFDVFLDSIVTGTTVEVWKDIFDSKEDFDTNTTPGTGTWALYSLDGDRVGTPFTAGLTDIWVRDTLKLSSGGQMSSAGNTFRQSVPEIDPRAIGGGLALVLGALALLERRFRQAPAYAGAC